MKISLLVPTRKRPKMFKTLCESAWENADNPDKVEIVAYIDDDDTSYDDIVYPNLVKVVGGRIVLSKMWNRCYEEANGEYFGHIGDDVVFRTKGWDTKLIEAFPDDKIAFVHGKDGSEQDKTCFGTHGFLHRNWIEAVGYFVPPYFSCDFNDTWLNDVSRMIDRHVFVDILTEHNHYAWGKRQKDASDIEREQRGIDDDVRKMYEDMLSLREKDAEKLRALL